MNSQEDWPASIPGAAQRAAERWGSLPGLIERGHTWTFAELWADARKAACELRTLGVQRGANVAIWAPNSRAWILAALGAQLAGGRIIPLNTRLKSREAGDILRRSRAEIVFIDNGFLGTDYRAMLSSESLPLLRRTIDVEEWAASLEQRSIDSNRAEQALADLQPDDISDIIFTSGTTGAPKGALCSHHQVTRTFGAWAERVDVRAGDRFLIVNPFFHTFGYKAGWVACLLAGATILPMPTFDVQQTIAAIEQQRVSVLPGPPTIYQSLLAEAAHRTVDFSSLRVAITGAATVPPVLISRMQSELGLRTIVTGYGMTECGVITMTRPGDPIETIASSCGCAMPGLELRIVDEQGVNCPEDTPGEILVRGHSVMTGYLDDPQATAEAIDGDGWLHTGDVGALDQRGYLRITDRKKDMYISGGFNCYPAEIEKMLCEHPAVEAAGVVGVADERLGEVGRAFIVLRPGCTVEEAELIRWARAQIANYKVPRHVCFLGELPKNAAGKVLRTELRQLAI